MTGDQLGGALRAFKDIVGEGRVVDGFEHTEYGLEGTSGEEYILVKLAEGDFMTPDGVNPILDGEVREFGISFRPHKTKKNALQLLWLRETRNALI